MNRSRHTLRLAFLLGCLSAPLSACESSDAETADSGAASQLGESKTEQSGSGENATSASDGGENASTSEDASTIATTGALPDAALVSADSGASDAGASRDASAARDAGRDAAPAPDAGSSDAGRGERTCGGIAALACAATEFCNYEPPNGQGCDGRIADAAGVCETKPQACTLQYDPVCGCDGKTYGNACGAHSAGVSVASRGECVSKATSCDRRAILCKRVEPVCPALQTAAVVGSCYGECVPIEQCACTAAEECPDPDMFTCHRSAKHCGPYVN